jgi:peroxiredoxin Q/BCP
MIKRLSLIIYCFSSLLALNIQIGDDAPNFMLKDQEGFSHNLISHKGSFVLLFFYPRDFTVSAQRKIRAMEKLIAKSLSDRFVVYGISSDTVENHRKFYDKMHITYDLLSDVQCSVIKAYNASGLIETKPLVVIVGPDGRVFKIYENMQKFLGERDIISFIINDSN